MSKTEDRTEFNRLLKEAICERHGNVREGAKAIGVSHAWLYAVLLHGGALSRDFLAKLEAAYPDYAGRMYDAAGIERPVSLALVREDTFTLDEIEQAETEAVQRGITVREVIAEWADAIERKRNGETE